MIIFQTKPKLVFFNNNKVYKFFDSNIECEKEIKKLIISPLLECLDKTSKYKMKFVKVLDKYPNYYTMEMVNGERLKIKDNIKNYELAGSWLRIFHSLSCNEKTKKVFLFSDFCISHLYIDHVNKEVTAIDPGSGFGTIGDIEIDISRFLVSSMEEKKFNIFKLKKNLLSFFSGYGIDKINYLELEKNISLRIKKNFEKIIKLKPGIKFFFLAYLLLLNSNFKYYLIKGKIKKLLN